MTTSVRLLDENLQWQESLGEYLLDGNSGFLVVGVLGKKGAGKSTLMSQLASGGVLGRGEEGSGSGGGGVFRVGSAQADALAQHCTNGVNAFVTSERTILLDVQVGELIGRIRGYYMGRS